MLTARVERLRSRLRTIKPSIDAERARLVTEFYHQCMVTSPVLRAKSTEYILKHMTIYIADDELLVGNLASEFRKVPVFPEYGSTWVLQEMDTFPVRSTDKLLISEKDKTELIDILKQWEGNSFHEIATAKLSKDVLEAEAAGVLSVGSRITSTGHVVPNYPNVLALGLSGLMEQAQKEIDAVEFVTDETQRKIDFWQAIIITCQAAIDFAGRYAKLARDKAAVTEDIHRKSELLAIAENCEHVPKNPPKTFWEALQFVWFTHLIMQIETNGHSIGLGRFDQYMNPFYMKDKQEHKIDAAGAQELIECMWLKITELIKVRDHFEAQAFAGFPMWQNVAIGGQTSDGRDAVNEMSWLVLEATDSVECTQPSVSFRYHDTIDPSFFDRAMKITQRGLATPAFFNDKLVIPLVLQKGATLEEARDWSIEGCVENYVTGKTDGRPVVGYVNTVKMVELVLNDGMDPLTGKQLGLHTGTADSFTTFEDLMTAYDAQTKYFVKLMLQAYNIVGALHSTRCPAPFASSLIDDCIKKGKSIQEGGAKYNFSGTFITALANASDALAAIHEAVFTEQKYTLSQLNKILISDFKDNERIRLMLLNKYPKYGNDNDLVDGIARHIVALNADELEHYRDNRGGTYVLSVLSQSFNVMQGKTIGATADGRHAYEPVNDNASPVAGRDVHGPTAALKSLSKIDQMKPLTGTLLNMKFDPMVTKGEKGLQLLEDVVKSYFDIYGEHIQINVVDEATLRDAQIHPENHENLMVRVAGYSAYFVELDKEVQENVIARTTHTGL